MIDQEIMLQGYSAGAGNMCLIDYLWCLKSYDGYSPRCKESTLMSSGGFYMMYLPSCVCYCDPDLKEILENELSL